MIVAENEARYSEAEIATAADLAGLLAETGRVEEAQALRASVQERLEEGHSMPLPKRVARTTGELAREPHRARIPRKPTGAPAR